MWNQTIFFSVPTRPHTRTPSALTRRREGEVFMIRYVDCGDKKKFFSLQKASRRYVQRSGTPGEVHPVAEVLLDKVVQPLARDRVA